MEDTYRDGNREAYRSSNGGPINMNWISTNKNTLNILYTYKELSWLIGKSRQEGIPELSLKRKREYIKARVQGTDSLLHKKIKKRTGKGAEREYKYMMEDSSNKEVIARELQERK